MTEKQKQCCVRIPEKLHSWAKGHAYHSGLSLQDYICSLIEEEKRVWESNQSMPYSQIDK
jgi:predicted HicB family RNase H-like nuclease